MYVYDRATRAVTAVAGTVGFTSFDQTVLAVEPTTAAGEMIVFFRDGRVRGLDLGAATLRPLGRARDAQRGHVTSVAYPAASRIAYETADGALYRIDLRTGAARRDPRLPASRGAAVAMSADGTVATSDGANEVTLWSRDGQRLGEPMEAGAAAQLAFSPDGAELVALTPAGLLTLWDVATRQRLGRAQLATHGGISSAGAGEQTALRFSANGDLWTATSGGDLLAGARRRRARTAGWQRSAPSCRMASPAASGGR